MEKQLFPEKRKNGTRHSAICRFRFLTSISVWLAFVFSLAGATQVQTGRASARIDESIPLLCRTAYCVFLKKMSDFFGRRAPGLPGSDACFFVV
jgi:hypothetical protein